MSSECNGQNGSDAQTAGRYKYQRLREHLRKAIEQGELKAKLPGERELARRYRANAKTINKALSDLTTEGLLVRHVGRGTFVANGHPTHAEAFRKSLLFGWLSPAWVKRTDDQLCYARAEDTLRRHGHRIERLSPAVDASEEWPEGTLSPGNLRELDGVILFSSRPSDRLLADLHRRHLPFVIVNNCHDRIKASAVVPDYAQGVFELGEHLIRLGHRAIQLLVDRTLLPAAKAAENGYLASVRRHGLQPLETAYAGGTFDWRGLLDAPTRPTALICVGGGLAMEASRKALDSGLRPPAELSITAMPPPCEARFPEQSITSYDVCADRLIDWTTELLLSASPGQLPRIVIVPGQVTDRGSAVPPASGQSTTAVTPGEGMT